MFTSIILCMHVYILYVKPYTAFVYALTKSSRVLPSPTTTTTIRPCRRAHRSRNHNATRLVFLFPHTFQPRPAHNFSAQSIRSTSHLLRSTTVPTQMSRRHVTRVSAIYLVNQTLPSSCSSLLQTPTALSIECRLLRRHRRCVVLVEFVWCVFVQSCVHGVQLCAECA